MLPSRPVPRSPWRSTWRQPEDQSSSWRQTLRTRFRRRLIIAYNADRDASRQIADYVCQQYSIPGALKIGFHMGTGPRWVYTDSRYSEVFVPLAALMVASGAQGILLCEGSPVRMDLPYCTPPTDTNHGEDTVRMLACAKRIVARNAYHAYGEPRYCDFNNPTGYLYDNGPVYPEGWREGAPWTTQPADYDTSLPILDRYQSRGYPESLPYECQEYYPYTRLALDPILEQYRGSWSGLPLDYYRWVDGFSPTFDGDFSRFGMLPYGRIGLPKLAPDGVFDADLYDKSKAIIDRGIALSKSAAQAKATTRLFFPFAYVGNQVSPYNLGMQALCYRKAADAGYTQLSYWYRDGTTAWDQAAIAMAPPAGGLSEYALHAGTFPGHTFDIAVGGGLLNGTTSAISGDIPNAWCTTSTGFVPAETGAIVMGGASYLYQWVQRLIDLDRLAAAFCNPWCNGTGFHHGTDQVRVTTGVFLAMLNGLSMLEASALGYEGSHYPMGNPLVCPFSEGPT